MMKKHMILSFILLLAILTGPVAAAADPSLLENGLWEGEGIPSGWTVVSYQEDGFAVNAADGVAVLSSRQENDLRLAQRLAVEADRTYILSGEISAEQVSGGRGASLSIDNYSIDGTYLYSKSYTGTTDWEKTELIFHTGPSQTEILVALRLGGYSELSRGTARFRNIDLRESEGAAGAIPLGGTIPSAPAAKTEPGMTEARRIQLRSWLHLFVVVAVCAAVFLLFGVYRNRERLAAVPLTRSTRWRWFLVAVLLGTVLRSALASAWGGHDTDMSCWMGWGSYIAQHGTADFYTAPGHEWYDYPPGYMLVLGLLSRVLQILRIPSSSDAAIFAYMLPAWAADVATALLIMRAAGERGWSEGWQLLLGVIILFQPAAVVLSGAWGQIDSILTLLLLLSFFAFQKERRIFAGALYGMAISVKWQALIYCPVFAAAYLLRLRDRKDVRDTVLGVAAALAVLLAVSLPFKGEQGLFWIVGRFFGAVGGYDYASVEAYNFLALLGGNWAPAGKKLLGLVSYKTLGQIAILAAVVLSAAGEYRESRRSLRIGTAPGADPTGLFLSAAFCMYMIFTFGHYMHERYVFPVIPLLIAVFVLTGESRFLFASLLLSAILFLNEMTAMYVVSGLAMDVVRSSREHKAVVAIGSLAETIAFLAFAVTAVDWVFFRPEKEETVHE